MSTTRTYTEAELVGMDRPEVRAIAQDLGVDPGSKYNTAAIIRRILAAQGTPAEAPAAPQGVSTNAPSTTPEPFPFEQDSEPEPYPHTIVLGDAGRSTVTFVAQGEMQTVTSDDEKHYNNVVAALLRGEDPTQIIIDYKAALLLFSEKTGAAVDVEEPPVLGEGIAEGEDEESDAEDDPAPATSGVRVNGQEIDGALVKTILRYAEEGRDPANLLRFIDRLNANPSERARQELFEWTKKQDLHIAPDGRFLGFKSFKANADGTTFRPHYGGRVFVSQEEVEPGQGVEQSGSAVQITLGSFVSMPRELCDPSAFSDCSVGLHVGSWGYAKGYGAGADQVIAEVAVDPADVVSVPASETDKLRCARYEVIGIHRSPSSWTRDESTKGDAAEGTLGHLEPPSDPKVLVTDDVLAGILAEQQVPKGFLARYRAKKAAKRAEREG